MTTAALLMCIPMLGLLTWAAATDIRARRIPNWLTASLALSGLAQSWTWAHTVSPWHSFLGLSAGDPKPIEYLQQHWVDVPRFFGAGFAIALYATTLAMLTASFTSRRAYASVFLVGLFVITTPFTVGLADELTGKAGQWMSMFNLTNIPVHVNDVIFGDVSEVTEDAPARELGSTILVAWWVVWTVVPGALLWWRYRKLSP